MDVRFPATCAGLVTAVGEQRKVRNECRQREPVAHTWPSPCWQTNVPWNPVCSHVAHCVCPKSRSQELQQRLNSPQRLSHSHLALHRGLQPLVQVPGLDPGSKRWLYALQAGQCVHHCVCLHFLVRKQG